MPSLTVYDEATVQSVKDLAVLGLVPIQIAERLELSGTERRRFLQDINMPKHPLHIAWQEAYQHHQDDVDASLTAMALAGDPDALFLIYKVQAEKELNNLKAELFGI